MAAVTAPEDGCGGGGGGDWEVLKPNGLSLCGLGLAGNCIAHNILNSMFSATAKLKRSLGGKKRIK